MKHKNLTGTVAGIFEVIEDIPGSRNPKIKVKCTKCGTVRERFKGSFVRRKNDWCEACCPHHQQTHGGSGTRLYIKYKTCEHTWPTFEKMLSDVEAAGGDKSSFIRRVDPNKPIGPDNFEFGRECTKLGTLISVNGTTKNLAGWARDLGITRERARQLHVAGRLMKRLKELK